MCLFWRSPTAWSPGSSSGDLIFNLAIAYSGKLEVGTRQLSNWRLRVPPDFLPDCQPGALSTRLHCSRVPRHHTRPPGRYKRYMLFTLFPVNNTLPEISFEIVQVLASKLTLYPLSHSWLMLRRLCFSPSTYSTFSIVVESLVPTSPLPRIFPLLLSPYVTYPSALSFRFMNWVTLPVMCFEQPLFRYH